MKIRKAVITSASASQRTLPLQTLVDSRGETQTALSIILDEVTSAGIEEICLVVCHGDQENYLTAAGRHAPGLQFVEQMEPFGYGHAVARAWEFTREDSFLLLVGDHLYVSNSGRSCAQQIVEQAEHEDCLISAVQATHESKLAYYGTVGGRRVAHRETLYEIDQVIEKPTPTEAEQSLVVPGLRVGHYLCFFGMHVLNVSVMKALMLLTKDASESNRMSLSPALNRVGQMERYLAMEVKGRRYDIGLKYGLLTAQLALALDGDDRNEVLSQLVELLAAPSV